MLDIKEHNSKIKSKDQMVKLVLQITTLLGRYGVVETFWSLQ